MKVGGLLQGIRGRLSRMFQSTVERTTGTRSTVQRPLHVFTRWYGFSLTFPRTEIYGAAPGR